MKKYEAENVAIRSAWESDKKGYKNSLEVLQNKLEVSNNSESLICKMKLEIEKELNNKSSELIK